MSENMDPTAHLNIGAAYYPEHWSEDRWAEDIRLMREAGFTVVRMAEFAWSIMEPAEGEFHFDWLDRAIDLLAANGISTVLGTPTAAPPAWLVEKYPEILAVEADGRKVQFGNRCHYCVTSPEFHTAVRRIVGAMARHFRRNPHIIGWQIDNEYNRVCYCEHCRRQFQDFLCEKYGSLESLNEHWSTRYWSQTYSSWAQIPMPVGYHNPGLMLELKHFTTACYRDFQAVQLAELKPYLQPEIFTTHNFMGWYDGFDHYALTNDLDLASWDWYIGTGHHDYLQSGATHDLTRGFKRRNFWLIETQPGNVNWAKTNSSLDKGEARLMAWHAVAHGADGVLYWQWRSAPGGQEQYHGTLVNPAGKPRPFYEEASQLGQEFKAVSYLLAGSMVKSRIAMLNDYDSRWSIGWQPHHGDFDYVTHFNAYYRPLAGGNVNVDILSADELLDGYRLVIAPALLVLDDKRVENLKEFVRKGGTLVLTLRTGMKDRFNALLPSCQPGALSELAGVEVEDYYALLEPVPVKGNLFEGSSRLWAERLKPLDPDLTIPIARYGMSNGWLDNQVAVTVHPFGKGMVFYVGAYLDETSQQALLEHILSTAGIPTIQTPPGVEVRTRTRPDGEEVYLVMNHASAEATLSLPWMAHEHLGGGQVKEKVILPPYGVMVLTKEKVDTLERSNVGMLES